MENIDLTLPVEIDRDIYWVGSSEEALLRRNIYLRVYQIKDKIFSMVIDPGPECDFDVLKKKVAAIIGDISRVNLVFINHQDPDVGPNAIHIQRVNPKALTLMTEDTWRLVQFFGLNPEKFRAVEKFRDMKASLKTKSGIQPDYILQFVRTPFCHFRGSCMYYDVNSRILFSGDFLGGISTSELIAEEEHWEGVKAFHQLYFPSKEAVRYALQKIRQLDPPPLMIAPQHGGIIKGEMIDLFMGRMEKLAVGLDLIIDAETELSRILELTNELARVATKELGDAGMQEVFNVFNPDGSYPALFTLGSNKRIRDIKGNPAEAVDALVQVILSFSNDVQAKTLKLRFMDCFEGYDFPIMDLSSDLENN